jgi:flagellar hook-associated protein 2
MSGISFSGLSSGIDFDSLRGALMSVERQALSRIAEKQSKLQLERDAFKDINTRLSSLTSKLSPILATGSSSLFSKVSATSSNTSVLTATAGSSAVAATYDVRVKNLALSESLISKTGATIGAFTGSIAGANLNTAAPPVTAATLLSDLNGGTGVSDMTSGIKIRSGASSATVDISTATTVGDVLTAINNSGVGVTAVVNGAGDGIDVTSTVSNRSLAIEENGGTTAANLGIFGDSHVLKIKTAADASYFKVMLNGGYDGNNADLSLADVRDSVNAVTGKTFSASLVDGRLSIASNNLGTANALQVQDNAANNGVLEQLGILITDALDSTTISNAFAGDNTQGGYLQQGTDALFSVNGLQVTRSKNTAIDDVITGVSLNLVAASTATGAVFPTDYASTSLTIKKDSATIATSVEDFVNQYNSVIDFVTTQTKSDPEGEDGTLASNSIARNLDSILYSQVGALNPDLGQTYRSIFDLKDSNGDYAFEVVEGGNGKIALNKTALTNLLNDDPEAVAHVFRYDSNSDGTFDGGIAYNLNKVATNYSMAGIGVIATQITSYETQIDDLDESLIRQQEIFNSRDAFLKKQFSSAETLISTLQSQSNYLSSQLSGMSRR